VIGLNLSVAAPSGVQLENVTINIPVRLKAHLKSDLSVKNSLIRYKK